MDEIFNDDFYKNEDFLKAYDEPNYEIYETPDYPISDDNNPDNLKTCVIYFSSNGWYSRENIDSFKEQFYGKNRFEWKKNFIKTAQKHIFVRDIFVTWYVKGINSKINTQDKLIEFLKEETKGYRVITIGTSGGGYMATLCGIKLNAYKIYSFCGQYALRFAGLSLSANGYYSSIEDMVREYKDKSIYYFAARDFVNDVIEYKYALSTDSIKTFLFKTDLHGVPFPVSALTDVINMPKNQLDNLYNRFKNKEINILHFAFKTTGIKFIFPIFKDSIRHFRKFAKNAFK